jgi:hypothetical protein
MMNEILRDFSQEFITVYIDDVCMYSHTLEEHLERLRLALQHFKEEGLKLRLKKCFFGFQDMEYLGYTISGGKLSVATKKIEADKEWPEPKAHREFYSFVHFFNSYAKFIIHHFVGDLSAPLTDLLRKSQPHRIVMTPTCLEAFETLKLRLISAPCLVLSEVSSGATFTLATCASAVGI